MNAHIEVILAKLGPQKAILGGLGASAGTAAILTAITRSIGDNMGGASNGQPKTTSAAWAAETKKYGDFQNCCNPITNDITRKPR